MSGTFSNSTLLPTPTPKANRFSEESINVQSPQPPRSASTPLPMARSSTVAASSAGSKPGPTLASSHQSFHMAAPGAAHTLHTRFLSPAEWARVAHSVGAIREGGDSETHNIVHPTSWWFPPKGLPVGLYRDVLFESTKNYYAYHILSTMRWMLMLLQLLIGAVMTALGSIQLAQGTVITVLAAVNTVDAGLIALMHNSGLPDRYRLNRVEFIKVEDYLKELLDTGVVPASMTVDEVLSDCFSRFQNAKNTVLANMPDAYTVAPHVSKEGTNLPTPSAAAHSGFSPAQQHGGGHTQ